MSVRPHQLEALEIGDEPGAWSAAGFTVDGDRLRIGTTTIVLAGADRDRGIRSAEAGIGAAVDGLPFVGLPVDEIAPDRARLAGAALPDGAHPNEVVGIDHLVAMSPDMDRTIAALTAAGLEHRRTRTFEAGGRVRRQAFFWLGDVILELVGDDAAHDEGPATLWGLALTCRDLDAAAERLGEQLGSIKPAVQPGRRIATVRTRELGISVPIALMSPHPEGPS